MERSGQVRHQQAGDSARGLALLDSETRATLGRKNWRQPPLTRPTLVLALALVAVLHILFGLALWYEMQPRQQTMSLVTVGVDRAMVVRLIEHPPQQPAVQPPAPSPTPSPVAPRQEPPTRVNPVKHEPPRRDAMIVQDHTPAPAPAVSVATPSTESVFSKDGSVKLPPSTGAVAATESTKAAPDKPADDRQIMQHDTNHMQYKATRFEKYFPPPNETAGGAVGRHIGDAIKEMTKSICDPTKPSTATNLLCGAPPPPASSKDRDARLNMPPAPLADDPNPPKGPSIASCIDEYKADKPLSPGCPATTPDLAFKAEMRECIDLYREGKRLKTWCPLDTPKRAAAESSTPADASSQGGH